MTSYSPILVAAIAVATLCGCASAKQAPTPADRVVATSSSGAIRTYEGSTADQSIIEAPPPTTLAALNSAYADLGIEVKLWNPQTGEVGNKNFTKMYRLAGKPLSDYVGCGTITTGQAADSYRVTMSLVSRVTPAGGVSRVETQLTAYAEDIGSSKGTLACLTLGTLEARLHDLAVRHLTG
ncbi:MAG TPA: hypothetical protein VNO24_09070 [Blastocatellia bacterium]|jgi:hypothetical protein|nr:hypothetical protein [Blastocatellia bacterium]